jgi:acyl-CoA thioester hydrolase
LSELTELHQSVVQPDEIDSLGHVNVRHYIARMASANAALLARIGIVAGADESLRRVDTYSRFHREQFSGATLVTSGGLIAGEGIDRSRAVAAYFEVRNHAGGELAATFIVTTECLETATQATRPLLAPTVIEQPVSMPRHGLPRSLRLTPPPVIALDEIAPFVRDDTATGMMSGRREGVVTPELCDAGGRLREDVELMFIVHRPTAGDDARTMGPPVLRDDSGRRYSWAMMETRSVIRMLPAAGDGLVSLGADVGVGDKWRQSRRWTFDRDTGTLLAINDTLGLCIDLDARSAMPIPGAVRAEIERNCLPRFA